MELSGLLLLLLLGLRHGFDPDHIAIIDGVSMRFSATKPRLAKWTGTLFAIGHGSVVTCIAVMISLFSHAMHFPQVVWNMLDWLPGLLLIAVGLMNIFLLTGNVHYRPRGLKSFFIPKRLKESSNPLAIVLIGILFAMVFDTNTQAAAWAYTATSKLSTWSALLLGISFSCGMIVTDTLDSRILFSLMKRSTDMKTVLDYRRKIGWIIASISLVVGCYKLFTHVMPAHQINENALTVIGISFFALMVFFYSYIIYASDKQKTDGY